MNLVVWLRQHPGRVIVSAVVAGLIGYVVNVWVMAVRYDGFQVPSGAPVTGEGSRLSGGLFWFALSAVGTALISYRLAVGSERFWNDVRALPAQLALLVRSGGAASRVQLLSGVAIGLLVTLLLAPATGAVVGVGLLAAAPSVVGAMLSSGVSRLWSRAVQRLAPGRPVPGGGQAVMAVVLVGAGLGLLVSFLAGSTGVRVVLLLAAGALAVVLASRGGPSGAAGLLLVVVVFAVALGEPRALADDGGYGECGDSWNTWLRDCAGTTEVLTNALGGAVAAALGAPFGAVLGSAAAAHPLSALPPVGEIQGRLEQLNQEVTDPVIYGELTNFFGRLRASGGQFGPAELAELQQLEGRQEGVRQGRLGEIERGNEAWRQEAARQRRADAAAAAAAAAAQTAALSAQQKAERLAELRQRVREAEREGNYFKRQAAGFGFLEEAAGVIGLISDRAIDVLAGLTGPAGAALKTEYTIAKGVGGALGAAMATADPRQLVVGAVTTTIDARWSSASSTLSKSLAPTDPASQVLGATRATLARFLAPIDPALPLQRLSTTRAALARFPSPYTGVPIREALPFLNPLRSGPFGQFTRDVLKQTGQSYAKNVLVRDPLKNTAELVVRGATGMPPGNYPWQGRDPFIRTFFDPVSRRFLPMTK